MRIRELFVYLISDSGAIFDAAARGRLLERTEASPVDRRSLEKWIARLEDTRLIVRLDPFARVDFVVHEGAKVRALVEVTVAKDPHKKLEQMTKLSRDLKAPNRSSCTAACKRAGKEPSGSRRH